MDDNLSLSEKVKDRFKRMFSGVFYQRYILGLWVIAEGLIYSMFNEDEHVVSSHQGNMSSIISPAITVPKTRWRLAYGAYLVAFGTK